MKTSAGTLLYRHTGTGLEVLLVRPAGLTARYGWSIPKGVVDDGESLEQTARRETEEETGVRAGPLFPLGFIRYVKSRKEVHGFGGPAAVGCAPRCASWEVSEARFVPLGEARRLLHPDQCPFLERLAAALLREELGHRSCEP